MSFRPHRRVAGLLAAVVAGAALPAVAQPWETTPGAGLRPLATPSPPAPAARPDPKPAPKPAQAAAAPAAAPVAAKPPAPRPTPAAGVPPYPRAPVTTTAAATPTPSSAARDAVIIIDTARIADPKTGVRQLVRVFDQLTAEFAARSKALTDLKAPHDKALLTLAAATPPPKMMADQAHTQIAQYDAAQKAYQEAFSARSSVLVTPVQQQINSALTAFANQRGAAVVIDGAKFNDAVLMLQPGLNPNSLDLTQAFIDSYNAAHP